MWTFQAGASLENKAIQRAGTGRPEDFSTPLENGLKNVHGKENDMPRHSFVRHIKLGDVKGRIDYIQNPKRQEHLYAAYDTAPETFWPLLAKQNRFDHRRSGTRGDCIEARELMIALPEALQEKDPDGLLKLFTDAFKEKYGVECVSALHHNKAMTNYHIHLIYSERKLKDRVEEKVASRNMFYDETGRHVRTKKEILDVDGNIRPGCYIVPKGMVYEYSGFQPKEKLFKQRSFTDEARGFFTGLINELVPEEDKLTVFPRGGPFLATQKIGKNNPKEAEIRKSNEVRQEWNTAVSGAMMRGMPVEDLKEMKKKLIIEPVAGSIKKHGKDPARFIRILKKAVVVLIEKARSFRPSILASLERFKDESAKQDRKRRSVREAVKDRERIAERSRKKSR